MATPSPRRRAARATVNMTGGATPSTPSTTYNHVAATAPEPVAATVVVRESVNAWWCPECDTAMPQNLSVCQKCGWERP